MTLITYNLYLLTFTLTDDLGRLILLPSAIPTLTIDTPVPNIKQISNVKSGRLWVMSDFDDGIYQVDNNGNMKEIVYSEGPFCVSKDDALFVSQIRFMKMRMKMRMKMTTNMAIVLRKRLHEYLSHCLKQKNWRV